MQAQNKLEQLPPAYEAALDSTFRDIETGNLKAAEARILQMLDRYPNMPSNAALLNNLASIMQQQKQYDEALLYYSLALEKLPNNATLRQNRAMLLIELGRLSDALLDYDELTQLFPLNEVYRYRRAMIYVGLDRLDEAENELELILKNNDSSLKTREGLALVKTRKGEYDEAERLYDYLLEKLPRSKCDAIYAGRARLFLQKGMNGFALRDIGKAFEAAGKPSAELYALRAEINWAIGDKKAAEEDFDLALRMGYSAEAIAKLKAKE